MVVPGPHALPRARRLTRSADIREAYAQGEKTVGRLAVLWARRGEQAAGRIAVVASRRSVGNAVQRNRARRRMRACFRLHQHCLRQDVDYVLVARHGLLGASVEAWQRDFVTTAREAGMWISDE